MLNPFFKRPAMKNKYQFLTILLTGFLLSCPLVMIAGTNPIIQWTNKNPFEQKVIIENKGQYSMPGTLYGAKVGGLNYFFSNNSILISHQKAVKRSEKEIEQFKKDHKVKEND